MSDYKVSLVPPEHVDSIWPAVEPFIEGALRYASGKYELEDVHSLLVDYGYPLWIAFDDRAIKGAAITRFVEYPRKKYLFVEFCGGIDGWAWKTPLLDTLRSWARDNGCDAIEASGRVGWARVLRDDGSKIIGQTFEIGI
jgi:hypothetical protein